jgi:hypothetical protein
MQTDVPATALPGLVNVSKILNDLALNATDKWEEKDRSDFILKRHPMLLQHLYFLTDEKDIQAAQQTQKTSSSAEEKDRAAVRWKQFLTSLAYYQRKGSMTAISDEAKLAPSSQDMVNN